MTISDCTTSYSDCKAKCFDQLVQNLATAGTDQQLIAQAKENYRKCKAICAAAKKICEDTPD